MSESGPAILKLRVSPNAARSEIAGWYGGALRVRVNASPVNGKANSAVVEILARCLGVSPRDVEIVRGHGSRDKVARVHGIDSCALNERLGNPTRIACTDPA